MYFLLLQFVRCTKGKVKVTYISIVNISLMVLDKVNNTFDIL